MGAAAGIGTAWYEKYFVGASGSDFALSPLQRLMLAGRVIWFYASKVVWPSRLIFIYPHWTIDPRVWWQYGYTVGAVAALGVFVWLARRNRAPLAAALYFTGMLFPVLGFLDVYPFRYSYVSGDYRACGVASGGSARTVRGRSGGGRDPGIAELAADAYVCGAGSPLLDDPGAQSRVLDGREQSRGATG
jgi:hypothetical protein